VPLAKLVELLVTTPPPMAQPAGSPFGSTKHPQFSVEDGAEASVLQYSSKPWNDGGLPASTLLASSKKLPRCLGAQFEVAHTYKV
jgi:hypothetical protein